MIFVLYSTSGLDTINACSTIYKCPVRTNSNSSIIVSSVVTNIRLGKLTTNIRTNFEMTTKRNVALCSAYAPDGVNIRRNLLLNNYSIGGAQHTQANNADHN